MSYVDGFVLPVPIANKEAYLKQARAFWPVISEYGAIGHVECWGDDLPDGKVTDFKKAVIAEEGETVVFSWVLWPSKEVRDEGNRKMMEDPRMKEMGDMPFDGKRMFFGGFSTIFDKQA